MKPPEKTGIIKGWKDISVFSGWSVPQLNLMEKNEGLPIYRYRVGGMNRVWADEVELTAFLRERQPGEPKPVKQGNKWVRRLSMPIVLLSLAMSGYMLIHEIPPSPKTLHPVFTRSNETGYIKSIHIENENNDIVASLWEGDGSRSSVDFKINHPYQVLAFDPGSFEREPSLFSILPIPRWISHSAMKAPDFLPLNPIETAHGTIIQDVAYAFCVVRLNHPTLNGWVVGVNSYDHFPGCLIVVDDALSIRAQVYHAGHIFNAHLFGDAVFISGCLNARADPDESYRPFIAKLDIRHILAKRTSQIDVMSPLLPDARRAAYTVKDCASLSPIGYVAFQPVPRNRVSSFLRLKTAQGLPKLWLEFNQMTIDERIVQTNKAVFDLNLNTVSLTLVDISIPGHVDRNELRKANRYQRWNGSDWGPWHATHE